jgi:hypothetical protein
MRVRSLIKGYTMHGAYSATATKKIGYSESIHLGSGNEKLRDH